MSNSRIEMDARLPQFRAEATGQADRRIADPDSVEKFQQAVAGNGVTTREMTQVLQQGDPGRGLPGELPSLRGGEAAAQALALAGAQAGPHAPLAGQARRDTVPGLPVDPFPQAAFIAARGQGAAAPGTLPAPAGLTDAQASLVSAAANPAGTAAGDAIAAGMKKMTEVLSASASRDTFVPGTNSGLSGSMLKAHEALAATLVGGPHKAQETQAMNPAGATLKAQDAMALAIVVGNPALTQDAAPAYTLGGPAQSAIDLRHAHATAANAAQAPNVAHWAEMVSRIMVLDQSTGKRGVMLELKEDPLKGVMVSLFEESGMWVVECECPRDPPYELLCEHSPALAGELAPRLERSVLLRVMRADPERRDTLETVGNLMPDQETQS